MFKQQQVSPPGGKAVTRQDPTSPASAKPVIEGRQIPGNIYRPRTAPQGNVQTLAAGFASNTVAAPASIAELARALKNNVDLIYEWIASNIEWLPTYGSQKGVNALIDGCGNSFDQSELMVELLRAAGYTADLMFGQLELTASEAATWFGTDSTNIWSTSYLLSNGGIPNTIVFGTPDKIQFNHVWVRCNVGGTNYFWDPARKTYTTKSGVNLSTAMSYSQSTFLSNARSGATTTADYTKNINRANVRSDLATYTSNLVSWLKANEFDSSTDDILGGKTINPVSGQLRQTSIPNQLGSPTAWTSIPDTYKATLHVVYDDPNINVTFFSKITGLLCVVLGFLWVRAGNIVPCEKCLTYTKSWQGKNSSDLVKEFGPPTFKFPTSEQIAKNDKIGIWYGNERVQDWEYKDPGTQVKGAATRPLLSMCV